MDGGGLKSVMISDFSGKVVIVTGGAGGLGKAFTLEFARLGAEVVCNDINPAAGEAVITEAADLPGRIHVIAGSMGEPATRDALAAKARDLGGVDVLCNNVGIQPPSSYVPAHELDDAIWDAILTINLKSYFWMVKRCVPMMRAQGRGVIINTASVQACSRRRARPLMPRPRAAFSR